MSRATRLTPSGYTVAVLVSLLTVLLRFTLAPLLQENAPLLVFIIPVMISAWYGGLGPGLLSTVLSGILGTYFFVPPYSQLFLLDVSNIARVTIFGIEGILISILNEALRRSRYKAQLTATSLQESEERYRLMVEGTRDYAIFMLDPNGYVVSWNTGAERLKGYKVAEILGRHFSILYPSEVLEGHNPEQILQQAVAEGQFEGEGWRRRKDGSLFWANFVITALRDSTGNLRGFSKITRDITERKQAEEEIRRAAQRLEALHDIDLAILEAESPTRIVQAALSRMHQLTPYRQAFVVLFNFAAGEAQVLTGSGDMDLDHAEGIVIPLNSFIPDQEQSQDGDLEQTRYSKYLAAVQHCPSALATYLPNGINNCIRVPLLIEKILLGELTLFLPKAAEWLPSHQEIVTEVANQLAIALQQAQLRSQLQLKAEELEQRVVERTAKLQEVNQELEAFAYSVSHDLRAPLRAIQGFAQAFLEDYGDRLDGLANQYAQRIASAAKRLDGLIQDLLSYSRIARTDLGFQSVNLTSVVEEALMQLEVELQERQTQVTVEKPLLPVLGHRSTLVQVMSNLLVNAIKFVEPGVTPQVQIWTTEQDDWVRLHIVDNGVGIAPQHQQRIFRIFERLHGAEVYPGTGIGLAIVRKGVERMNGQVGVESQVGEGSCFWIELHRAG